jgi:PAS domain S-box-containing protein
MKNVHAEYTELTFQLIVESSPNAIILVNKEGKIAYINSQTEKLFGYTRNELIGQMVEALLPTRYSAKHHDYVKMFFASPSVRSMGVGRELFALRKDKTEFPIEIGLNPIITINGTLVLASIIDISERKKAEEQFRMVVESAPNAMLLANSDGIITLVNKQTEVLFGYERNELVGNKLETLIPKRFSNHADHRTLFFKNPQARSMGAGRDLFGKRKDGTEVQIEIGLNPIETGEGQMVLASIIDITERKMQENVIKKQIELEIKNKELEQFAYVASHDLQEPLRTVSNYMKIFEEDYSDRLDENAYRYLRSVDSATKRMSIMVQALLDFSRLGSNKKVTLVSLEKIITNVIADLHILVLKSKAIIDIGEMPSLHVYEVEVGQLFQNLITNAIKFQKKGETPHIQIQSEKLEDKWQFSIRDNGIGIDPKHFKRIFDIFQRLHGGNEYEGNGIGLANCKKIVSMHEGEIWVESGPGKGTTFIFTISNLAL